MINLGVSQEFPHACQLIAVFSVYLLAVSQEMKLQRISTPQNLKQTSFF